MHGKAFQCCKDMGLHHHGEVYERSEMERV